MPSRERRTRKKPPPITEGRQVAQFLVPFLLPMAWFGSLTSLFRLEYTLAAYALSPLIAAAALAFGYCTRVAAKKAASASVRPVPRLVYGLSGLCFFGLTVALARMCYAYSHASGNAAASVTLGFLAFYCLIAGVLCLGRAVTWGPKRLAFWVFLPRWLLDSQRSGTQTPAPSMQGRRPWPRKAD